MILSMKLSNDISSVIRQKGEYQNGCFKKTKHAKFSDKRTFLTFWYAHVHIHTMHMENLGCFVFLKHPFWDSPLVLVALLVSCSPAQNLKARSKLTSKTLESNMASFIQIQQQRDYNCVSTKVLVYIISIKSSSC